jgi:hypothetical protein
MKNSCILTTSAFYYALTSSVVVHAGTNKTLAPTPAMTRETPSPVTPFPTESITPAPTPGDVYVTPAPYETPAPVEVYVPPPPVPTPSYVPPVRV